eukprot:1674807-Ditylum_brightwellii.AAC.1
MINKAALEAADATFKMKVQTFIDLTRTKPLVSVVQERFVSHALRYVKKVGNFSVRSYLSLNGCVLNASDADGNLLPFMGQDKPDKRPEGIYYVKIASDLTFSDIDPSNTGLYPFTFFVRLPVETRQVTTTAARGRILWTTFFGAATWAKSTNQTVIDSVLDSTSSLKRPFALLSPAINDSVQDASVDYTGCNNKLVELCLSTVWEHITAK